VFQQWEGPDLFHRLFHVREHSHVQWLAIALAGASIATLIGSFLFYRRTPTPQPSIYWPTPDGWVCLLRRDLCETRAVLVESRSWTDNQLTDRRGRLFAGKYATKPASGAGVTRTCVKRLANLRGGLCGRGSPIYQRFRLSAKERNWPAAH